jgi:uncharacterized coiled-coil protein SlyX
MEALESNIGTQLLHLNEKLQYLDGFLGGRLNETREWLASLAKKIEGNGTTSYEARLKGLEILVEENAKAIRGLADAIKEEQKVRSKYGDMVANAVIQFAITALTGAGVLYALWEKGMLGK